MYFPAMFSNICGFSAHGKRAEYKWDNFPALSSAYTIGNNLYVNEQAVTNEPEGIVCGQSVHRNVRLFRPWETCGIQVG